MAKKDTHQEWLKKLGFQEIEVHMGMFDYSINVIVGKYDNFNEYVNFKLEDDEFDGAIFDKGFEPRGRVVYREGFRPILWIPRKPKTNREYATLAHESLHCMYHVVRWAGIPTDDSTEEVMTHGMGHIINEVLEHAK